MGLPTPDSVFKWYLVSTRSRHEHVVRRQLVQKQIETFLPTVTRWSQWTDRRKRIDWPLFPGYCFARFDAADSLTILVCAGVLSIVRFEAKPAPVPDVEVERLRALVNTDLHYDPCPFVSEGTWVDMIGGPLRGATGRLLGRDADHASVALCMDLIGQAVRVEVSAADVQAR